MKLHQDPPEGEGDDDQRDGPHHAGDPTPGEQGVDGTVAGVGDEALGDQVGQGLQRFPWLLDEDHPHGHQNVDKEGWDGWNVAPGADKHQDDRQQGPPADREVGLEDGDGVVDLGGAHLAVSVTQDPEENEGDDERRNGGPHHVLDVGEEVTASDGRCQVGGIGQGGHLIPENRPGNDRPGNQGRVDVHRHPHPEEGDADR